MEFKKRIENIRNTIASKIATDTFARGKITSQNYPEYEPISDYGGSRNTRLKDTGGGGMALPRRAQRELRVDPNTVGNSSIEDLISILIDSHPDVSYALWNFLRICNCDYTVTVTSVDSGDRDENAELEINNFIKRLGTPNVIQFERSRHFSKVLNQLVMNIVTRGACALELVPTKRMDDIAFIAVVDPATVSFKVEGDRYVPYQHEDVKLDVPTFFYEGLDETADSPYGRSPFTSALNMVLFQIEVLNDIKAVVHNQGYPRFDIKILEEVLLKRMPINIRNNEAKKGEWLSERLTEIAKAYQDLDPDASIVHFDSVEIGMAGGSSGTKLMFDPDRLMHVIDNMVMAGLKTLSTILGRRSTGNTESFAKMEIKLYMKGVEAILDVVESILNRALTLYLNFKGMQGVVSFKFAPAEIRTDLEQEQMNQIRYQNLAYKRDQGWATQDEVAISATGHPSVAEPDKEMLKIVRPADTNADGGKKQAQTDEKPE